MSLLSGSFSDTIQTAEANRFAANLLPIIRSIQSAGPIGMVSIAKLLNERGVRIARGGHWHVSSVATWPGRTIACRPDILHFISGNFPRPKGFAREPGDQISGIDN